MSQHDEIGNKSDAQRTITSGKQESAPRRSHSTFLRRRVALRATAPRKKLDQKRPRLASLVAVNSKGVVQIAATYGLTPAKTLSATWYMLLITIAILLAHKIASFTSGVEFIEE